MGKYPTNELETYIDSQINKGIFCYNAFEKICNEDPIKVKILSRIFFWSKTKSHGDFYKTDEELSKECHMKMTRFKSAKKQLINLGFIDVKIKGVPAKTHYKFNHQNIMSAIHAVENNVSFSDALVKRSESDQLNKSQYIELTETEEYQISRNPTNRADESRIPIDPLVGIRPTNTKNTTNNKKEKIYKKEKINKINEEEVLCASESHTDEQKPEKIKDPKNYMEKENNQELTLSSMPDDFFVPEDWINYVITNYGAHEEFTRNNALKFVNYYISKGKKHKDWRRIWFNWILNHKNNSLYEKNFSKISDTGSPITPKKSQRERFNEYKCYRERTGMDKLICDEIRRISGDYLFWMYIEDENVTFNQPKEGARVEFTVSNGFIRQEIENKLLMNLSHLNYVYNGFIDPSMKPLLIPEISLLDIKVQDMVKKQFPEIHKLLMGSGVKFLETFRPGVIKMSGCSQDIWDKLYNKLNPILQDYLELKISEGKLI